MFPDKTPKIAVLKIGEIVQKKKNLIASTIIVGKETSETIEVTKILAGSIVEPF